MTIFSNLKDFINNKIGTYKRREILKALQDKVCFSCIGLKCDKNNCPMWNMK